jgi:AbrB family looped-hinge helix DNA binding protein
MAIGRVQSRGQITLPRDVRRAAHIEPGDTVTIQAVGPGTVQVRVLSRLTLRDLIERYPIEGPVAVAADRARWEAEAAREVLGHDGV